MTKTNDEIMVSLGFHEIPIRLSMVYAAMTLARADERDNKWISMETRLPTKEDTDKWGTVLVQFKTGRILTACWDEISSNVTHWQILQPKQ